MRFTYTFNGGRSDQPWATDSVLFGEFDGTVDPMDPNRVFINSFGKVWLRRPGLTLFDFPDIANNEFNSFPSGNTPVMTFDGTFVDFRSCPSGFTSISQNTLALDDCPFAFEGGFLVETTTPFSVDGFVTAADGSGDAVCDRNVFGGGGASGCRASDRPYDAANWTLEVLPAIGSVQTFGDDGDLLTGPSGDFCDNCVFNGWVGGHGGIGVVPDSGEDGVGDNAFLYDSDDLQGNPRGFHFLTWYAFSTADTGFLGDYTAAHVIGLSFRARHSGNGADVNLRAYLFHYESGFDWAYSNGSADIANIDTDWQTYTIDLLPADLLTDGAGMTPAQHLQAVEQIGLRHDPAGTGPGTPAEVSAQVYFDDLQLIINPDIDNDGIANEVDDDPLTYSADFGDGTTSGSIVSLGGQTLSVGDEPAPDGIRINAAAGGGSPARVRACGASATLTVNAGNDLVVTCGSVHLTVDAGPAVEMEIMLGDQIAIVSVPPDNTVVYEPETSMLSVTTTVPDPEPVVLSVGGAEIPIPAGEVLSSIDIDIKPGSYPNCFNINGHGVIPVAVLGDGEFDVSAIDVETLYFAGLAVRVRGNQQPSCGSEDVNDDGYQDLVCKFEDDASAWNAGNGVATLTSELLDGTLVSGTDTICVVP